jgi:anti-sigma factor RsiW
MDSLEQYLDGSMETAALREFKAHLSECAACREEVAEMHQISQWMVALKPVEQLEPAPNFYARVMAHVGGQKPMPTFASLFALDLSFGRRLAFACLVTLAVLGSFLVSMESGEPARFSPETVMAQQDSPSFDSAKAHEAMLATLTDYEP